MHRPLFRLVLIHVLALLALFGARDARAQVDEQLTANKRVFKPIGPGLRALRYSSTGTYYILANNSVLSFDSSGKQLGNFEVSPAASVADKSKRPLIGFASDIAVDAIGNLCIADRSYNLVSVFTPEGALLRSIPVTSPLSIASLPEGEIAVCNMRGEHLITVYGLDGHITREFGQFEDLATRQDLNHYLNQGHLESDATGHVYYGFNYVPEPLVRQFDRFGFSGTSFEFTNLDAFSEARASRREIARLDKRPDPPNLPQILTGFGVDPVNGDLWMCLHNTLLHFDKEGNRRSEYQIYTPDGTRLEGTVVLVEEKRLLIGADPLGIFEFARPDRPR